MQHYQINIDMEDIMGGKVDKKLKQIDKAIDVGIKNGMRKCDELFKAKLLERMDSYQLGGSELSSTIRSTVTPNSLSIRMGSKYFMYVEYGTGVVGRDASHPDTSRVGWRYDKNEHGEMGWWYPSSTDDPNPTKYRGKTGWWAWTKGQRARPFMYETWLWGMQRAADIIAIEIGKEIKKLERMS